LILLVYEGKDLEDELRPYRIAKTQNCRFYFGSDAHGAERFENQ
jgi:histidinol phosphatase-like PHP family hydrolase